MKQDEEARQKKEAEDKMKQEEEARQKKEAEEMRLKLLHHAQAAQSSLKPKAPSQETKDAVAKMFGN